MFIGRTKAAHDPLSFLFVVIPIRRTWKKTVLVNSLYENLASLQLTSIMTSKDFVKLRHRSRVFTARNIAALQKALDFNDFVSLVFLMCGNDQIKDMYEYILPSSSQDMFSLFQTFPGWERTLSSSPQDLYSLFRTFPGWERTLPQALGAIKNKLALIKLGISPKDLQYNRIIKDSELALCPTRVALYRIIDELSVRDGEKFFSKMVEFGAPQPPVSHLEGISHSELLSFMFWHSQGFLNIERRERFEIIGQSLMSIHRGDLASYFIPPQMLHDSYVFEDHPLEVYHIKEPKTPGLCVVINQVKYGGREKDRDSSAVNASDLVCLMESLNFFVVKIENLSGPGFCDQIKSTVVSNFSKDHSIFVLIIMGHGEREGVLCPSERLESCKQQNGISSNLESHENWEKSAPLYLEVVRIENIQHSLFECKELETIPKVLILNACRGQGEFTTRDYFLMAADGPDGREILSHVDIITCYSALPEFVSWRDPQKGSLFIHVFCDILTRRPDIEICELFTLMNARLMQPTADMSEAFAPGHKGYYKRTALPFDFTSSLRKKLYFRLPETCTT